MPVAEPSSPPAPPRSLAPRLVVVVIVAFLVVLAGAFAYVFLTRPPSTTPTTTNVPPHVVSTLGNGSVWMDLPLWALYTPPSLSLKGWAASVNLSTSSANGGPSTRITYRWGDVHGASEEVRFVLVSAVSWPGEWATLRPEANNSFVYLPDGLCEDGCTRRGSGFSSSGPNEVQDVQFVGARLNYTVVRMAETNRSVDRSWFQVNYILQAIWRWGATPLPAANVTAPGPGDLIPASEPLTYNFTRRQAWAINASVRDFSQPAGGFHNSLPAVTFLPGSSTSFNASLRSTFAWDPSADSWVGLSADWGTMMTLQWFFDARFGTLVAKFT